MRKYPIHEHRVKQIIHYTPLEEVSKKIFMTTIYSSNYAQKCSQLLQ